MAENLIILLIFAAIIGTFWLVLLSAVWRRHRRALWNRSKVDASMKKVRWTLAFLGAAGALLILSIVLPAVGSRSPKCIGRIVIIKEPHGLPLECVCEAGIVSTCFNPGP